MKKRIAILGATGYTGEELIKRLIKHRYVEIVFLSSRTFEGKKIWEIFSSLKGEIDLTLEHPDKIFEKLDNIDIVFTALPHTASAEIIKKLYDRVEYIIDLSADFRLDRVEDYLKWYKQYNHPATDLWDKKVYGLVEIYRDVIKNYKLIANPGCYPTSVILGLYPLAKEKLIENEIIVDSKSSISGAGRSLKYGNLFVEMNENLYPYNAGHSHRHISEMEQEISKALGEDIYVIFTPQVIPIQRGILSSIYVNLKKNLKKEEILEIYNSYYKNEYFIKVIKDYPKLSDVSYTNYCEIGVEKVNEKRIIVFSAIDNIVKGASGQAIQNMNVLLGIDEREGLI